MKHLLTTYLFIVLGFVTNPLYAEDFAFRLQDSTGKIHQLSDYKGKWVLVNFWATWCPPCLEEIPDLVTLYEDRNDIMVFGVAMEYSEVKTVLEFAKALAVTYPIVLGNRTIAAQFDELSMLPSTYLFDPKGNPAARKVGLLTRADIEAFIQNYPK